MTGRPIVRAAALGLVAVATMELAWGAAAPVNPPGRAALDVPIALRETAGIRRAGEPLTFGVPLAESLGIRDATGLGIQDEQGRWVPAQFSVLARWGGPPGGDRPIKWLLADLQADVRARSTATYRLRAGRPAPTAPSLLSVVRQDRALVVSTGKLRFRVQEGTAALLDEVRLLGDSPSAAEKPEPALIPELVLAPVTMVGRASLRGASVLPLSSVDGVRPGDRLRIAEPTWARVAAPRDDRAFAERFPQTNRRGGRYLRIVPYPTPDRYPPGTRVIVNEGAANEETVTVASLEPDLNLLVLGGPLGLDHAAGEGTTAPRVTVTRVREVLDAHRIAIDPPLAHDHQVGGLVTADAAEAVPLRVRARITEPPVVETEGPVRVTVGLRGRFEISDTRPLMGGAIEFSARVTGFVGADHLQLEFTLENNGPYGFEATTPGEGRPIAAWLFLRELVLAARTSSSPPLTVTSEPPVERAFGDLVLFQDYRGRGQTESQNFIFRVTRGGRTTEHTGRLSGWLDASDRTSGLTVVVRDFWQNYPKTLAVTDGGLSIGLWPAGGFYPDRPPGSILASRHGYYQLEGGRHKTHELVLRWHRVPEDRDAAEFARAVNAPLLGVLPGRWYAESGALGMFAPAGLRVAHVDVEEALRRYEKLHRAFVHRNDAEDPPVSIHTVREKDPAARRYAEPLYGWMNFGDLPWEEGYSSLHYDWPYGMLLQFVRTGDPAFFHLGREMALHRIDIDHIHGNRGEAKIRYLQRYETDSHGNAFGRRPRWAHTWSGGIALFHVLTGHRRALEATLEVAQSARDHWGWLKTGKSSMEDHEIRQQGWAILALVHAYRIGGDVRDLEVARALFRNSLLHLEQQSGGRGFWAHQGDPGHVRSMQIAFVLDPLIQLHHEAADPELLALLGRIGEWSRRELIVGGESRGGLYRPLAIPYVWQQRPVPGDIEPIRNLFFADLFAYLHRTGSGADDLALARRLFRDAAFWFTFGHQYVPSAARSPVSYTLKRFPGSETKVGAWFAKHPQTYLHTEWRLQESGSHQGGTP